MTKKIPKIIGPIHHPILIVGEKIGKQRIDCTERQYALVGNRTGDFVAEAIGSSTNIILTNLINHNIDGDFLKVVTKDMIQEGLLDLWMLIRFHEPCKIILLGGIAQRYARKIDGIMDYKLVDLPHPSWINRFHSKDRHFYIEILKQHLT